jgi:hypothetical protein
MNVENAVRFLILEREDSKQKSCSEISLAISVGHINHGSDHDTVPVGIVLQTIKNFKHDLSILNFPFTYHGNSHIEVLLEAIYHALSTYLETPFVYETSDHDTRKIVIKIEASPERTKLISYLKNEEDLSNDSYMLQIVTKVKNVINTLLNKYLRVVEISEDGKIEQREDYIYLLAREKAGYCYYA